MLTALQACAVIFYCMLSSSVNDITVPNRDFGRSTGNTTQSGAWHAMLNRYEWLSSLHVTGKKAEAQMK